MAAQEARLSLGGSKSPSRIAVNQFFKDNKMAHLNEASRDLGFSKSKVWFILRKILKSKPYKPAACTVLTKRQQAVRLDCARWFIRHDRDFLARKVIWGDEKFFLLHQSPNRKNECYWRPENPYEVVQCKQQGVAKAMCWVFLCDGKVIGPVWIEGTMDQYVYREVMEDHVWPVIRHVATRNSLWLMQDGATCHTTRYNMDHLKEKFGNRIISNKSEQMWPPCSPDCNPLDYFFWGHAMAHIFRCKPSTMAELKVLVNRFGESMDKELIRKVCGSTLDRLRMLEIVKGVNFENKKGEFRKDLPSEE